MAALPRDLSVCLYIGRLFLSLYDPCVCEPQQSPWFQGLALATKTRKRTKEVGDWSHLGAHEISTGSDSGC